MAIRRFLHARVALTTAIAAIVAAVWIAPRVTSARLRPTDFDLELRRMEDEIAALTKRAAASTDQIPDAESAVRVAYVLFRRASLTGRPEDFDATQAGVDRARASAGPMPELSLLQATLDVRFHRLAAARLALERVRGADATWVSDSPDAQALLADIDVQDGRYDAAAARLNDVARRRRTWDILSRLAYIESRRGDIEAADRMYAEAEDEVTAKEMRAYAWLELQRGQVQFGRGRYDAALAHYTRARQAYSGHWLADEYLAELLGAQRKFDEAIDLYRRAIARAPRPDLLQQLGDLYAYMGKPRDAKRWHDEALAGYLASVGRGEVQFVHHLAAFYADVAQDGSRAIEWARNDAALRRGYVTDDALAWALYRGGRMTEALDAATAALASGIADAHVYFHAATINTAAGRVDAGRRLLGQLAAINPRYDDFHVHR